MARRYTLAIGADMLLVTVPDGGDIAAAVKAEAVNGNFVDDIPEYKTYSGCELIDGEPPDLDRVVWQSGNCGWIFDETGREWGYAIRPEEAA